MSENISIRIVNFLLGLPQFHDHIFNGKEVARRITDGTIFIAPEDPDHYE